DEIVEVVRVPRAGRIAGGRADLLDIEAGVLRHAAAKRFAVVVGDRPLRQAAQDVRHHRAMARGVVRRLVAAGQVAFEPGDASLQWRRGRVDAEAHDADLDALAREPGLLRSLHAGGDQLIEGRVISRRGGRGRRAYIAATATAAPGEADAQRRRHSEFHDVLFHSARSRSTVMCPILPALISMESTRSRDSAPRRRSTSRLLHLHRYWSSGAFPD